MFKKILFPIDMSEESFAHKALKIALHQGIPDTLELHVLTVIPGFNMPLVASFFPEDTMEKAIDAVHTQLKEYVAKNIPSEIQVSLHIAMGNPYKEILKCCDKIDADLIVLQSHNPSLTQTLLGSVASEVVEHAQVSVMIIRS